VGVTPEIIPVVVGSDTRGYLRGAHTVLYIIVIYLQGTTVISYNIQSWFVLFYL